MRAMVFEGAGKPLAERDVATPAPQPGQLLIRVSACGVCRTDLHVFRGELANPKPHLILGHEIVGTVVQIPRSGSSFSVGDQVGVPWLGWTCGTCAYCLSGRENLCDRALFTGYTLDGGYAEYTVADERFCVTDPARLFTAASRPSALRGADRLQGAGQGRRCTQPRHLRIWRCGAHRGPGRRASGPQRFRVHAPRRSIHAGICSPARRGLGRRLR